MGPEKEQEETIGATRKKEDSGRLMSCLHMLPADHSHFSNMQYIKIYSVMSGTFTSNLVQSLLHQRVRQYMNGLRWLWYGRQSSCLQLEKLVVRFSASPDNMLKSLWTRH